MERLPPTEFGRVLRALVREQWGTQIRFAQEIGFDETWVAKVIRGDQESLTYASLQRLLSGLKGTERQERLYQAWLTTYAPSPGANQAPDSWDSDETIVAYAGSVHELISGGKVLETYQALGRLWKALAQDPKRQHARLAVGSAYVETAQQLDRISVALSVSQEMIATARSMMEPALMARALWLRGVSLRLVRPRKLAAVEKAFCDLSHFLSAWHPASAQEREIHSGFSHVLLRDQVLSAIDIVQAGKADKEVLARRTRVLLDRSTELEQVAETGLANEVAARAMIVAGMPDDAVPSLHVAAKCAVDKVCELKVIISQVQLLQATGDVAQASDRLGVALDLADEYRLVHHRQKLASIQRGLETLSGTRVFPMG
jgi:hypothetical protein